MAYVPGLSNLGGPICFDSAACTKVHFTDRGWNDSSKDWITHLAQPESWRLARQ